MKKVLLLSSILGLGAVASYGSTGPQCSALTVPNQESATSLSTCEIGDKIFSNLSETGLAAGDNILFSGSGTVYNLSLDTGSAPITTGFTLSFTVTVDPTVCAACVIIQNVDQMFTQQVGTGTQIPNASTATITTSTGSPSSITLDAGGVGANETKLVSVGNTTEAISFQYSPDGIPGNGPAGQLSGLTIGISQSAVPEPMTFSLMGAGLLGLGLLRKRIGRS